MATGYPVGHGFQPLRARKSVRRADKMIAGRRSEFGGGTVFGIIGPCRHRMQEGMAASWLAHLCGLCLALRDGHGQFARVATNYDGPIISVLVEAQSTPADDRRRTAGPCPLRGMRSAPVAMGEGARPAAAVSPVLASAKVRDHVEDGDGAFGRRPVAAAAWAARRVPGLHRYVLHLSVVLP